MELLIKELEKPKKCNDEKNDPITVFLAVFIAIGILVSYLPQHYKIFSTKSSEGISPLFLLLGAISMTCSYFNILILQFNEFGCCKNVYPAGYCFENVLGIIQLTIQWFCFTMILVLFMIYFPDYKKYIPNISLGSGYNNLSSISSSSKYSKEWSLSLQVTAAVAIHFIFTLIISAYLLIFVGGAKEEKVTRYWADLLGVISLILASIQYLPQIWKTWKRKSVGALSIQMMLLQTPGSFLFAYSLASSPGTRWSTWIVFLITGCLQGTLLIMCICWHYREKHVDEEIISDGRICVTQITIFDIILSYTKLFNMEKKPRNLWKSSDPNKHQRFVTTTELEDTDERVIYMKDLSTRKLAYGICGECNEPGTGENWCQPCNAKRFEDNFKNWTSANKDIDEFIQESQLNAVHFKKCLEWIPFEKFQNITYVAKGGFGKIYSAEWPEGISEYWDIENQKWHKITDLKVALKSLDNSSDISSDFLNEIKSHLEIFLYDTIQCFGVTQDPNTKDYMMILIIFLHYQFWKFQLQNA
ncbi:unnamed protein product [Rhizophagus irregularis]|nr:unnamed protein product [Rhizophagus irregularis]